MADATDIRACGRREFLRKSAFTMAGLGLGALHARSAHLEHEAVVETMGGRPSGATRRDRVWMTYVNVVKSVDDDFRDMKAHGVDVVEINMYPAIWTGEEIDLAEALRCARKHDVLLAFAVANITMRADRVAAHDFDPVPAVMIGGAYDGKGIDWHRFSFSPQKHRILIDRPVFGPDWTLGGGIHFAQLLAPHRAEVIVAERPYDGHQHLTIIPADIRPADGDVYEMRFDLGGVKGDLDNTMLAVYWRMRGPILEQPQATPYFGNTASPHAPTTSHGLRDEVRHELSRWTEANGGAFPEEVIGVRIGDEDFLETVPNGPTRPDQSIPLWDYSEEGIAAFRRLNPEDEYPRHWTYREAFGEHAYADWMWGLHKACADLLGIVKETLTESGLGSLLTYRNITRCNTFYLGNDHGGVGPEMAVRALDVVQTDPYPSERTRYQEHAIPGDVSYVAGLARRHGKQQMPWLQGHPDVNPPPTDLRRNYEQHAEHEPEFINYLGYGTLAGPPLGTGSTFPLGNPASWEEARRINADFKSRTPSPVRAKIAAIRDYRVWGLSSFSGEYPLDEFLTGILRHVSVQHGVPYDPVEVRSLDAVNWAEISEYQLTIAALPVSVSAQAWEALSALPSSAVLLCPDTRNLAEAGDATAVRRGVDAGLHRDGTATTETGESFPFQYGQTVSVDPDAAVLARVDGEACIWRAGRLTVVTVRISPSHVGPFVEWLASHGHSELTAV